MNTSRYIVEAMAEQRAKTGSIIDRDLDAQRAAPDFDTLNKQCNDMADDIMIDLHEDSWVPFKRNFRKIVKSLGDQFDNDNVREEIMSMNISDKNIYDIFRSVVNEDTDQ